MWLAFEKAILLFPRCETHAVHLLGTRSGLRSHLSEKGGLKQPKGYAAAAHPRAFNSLVVFVHPEPVGFDYHRFLRTWD